MVAVCNITIVFVWSSSSLVGIDLRRSSADSVGTYGATAAMLPIDGPVIEPADVDGGDLDESEEKRVLR